MKNQYEWELHLAQFTKELLRNLEADTLVSIRCDLRKKYLASLQGIPSIPLAESQRRFSDNLCCFMDDVTDTLDKRATV